MSRDELRVLGAHVAEQLDGLLEPEGLDASAQQQMRHTLVERVRERSTGARRGQRRRHGWAAATAGVLALGAVGLARLLSPGEESLRFTVGLERHGTLQALEAAPENAELPLSFSDGSVVDLAPGARARVAALRPDGAEVVLESGQARVDVVPRPAGRSAHWKLRSGPFAVQVKGTSFWLRWDPGSTAFSLDLLVGEVFVTGCGLGEGREIRAGERIEASCKNAESADAGTAAAPTAEHTDSASARRASSEPELAAPASKPAATRKHRRTSAERDSWQRFALEGDFARAHALAFDRGWQAEIASASPEDLLLLAQTARVTGHVDEARAAYEAARRRFGGTDAATRAAFGLGVLAFDAAPKQARQWFETYLAEQPAGPLSGAALDRLFEATLRADDSVTQRRIAKRYVEQNGSGPHVAEARRLLAGAAGGE